MRKFGFVSVLFATLFFFHNANAVRPFVTDDARIVSKGQVEMELWPELNVVGDEHTYAFQGMFGYSFTEWFELIIGSGAGWDRRPSEWTFANPVIAPKFLLLAAEENSWVPGIALALGVGPNAGRGSLYDDAISRYAFLIATWRPFDDWLNIHVNLGERAARINQVNRSQEYWGLGFDIGVIKKEYRVIAEVYSGDPFEALAPEIAYQWGGRWLKSEYVNFDITMGTQKEPVAFGRGGSEREYWIQFGIRLLFDTPIAKDSSADGARGLIPRWF